jgi:hypothetical protein
MADQTQQDDPALTALSDTLVSRMGTSIRRWMSTLSNHDNVSSLHLVINNLKGILQYIDFNPTLGTAGKSHDHLKCDSKAT